MALKIHVDKQTGGGEAETETYRVLFDSPAEKEELIRQLTDPPPKASPS